MRLQLDHLRLSVQPDGSWVGDAEVVIDGELWAGQVIVGLEAQATLRRALANMDRRALVRAQKRAYKRTRREMGLCISCPEKSPTTWRCYKCARRLSLLRAQRKEMKSA